MILPEHGEPDSHCQEVVAPGSIEPLGYLLSDGGDDAGLAGGVYAGGLGGLGGDDTGTGAIDTGAGACAIGALLGGLLGGVVVLVENEE